MSDQPTAADRFRTAQARLLAAEGAQATSRLVRAQGGWVHLIEAGGGRPVVLVHDGGSVAATWVPLMAGLQDTFHVYAPDRPGSGLTDRQSYGGVSLREHAAGFLLSVLDSLGLGRVNLVGAGMGGYWALAFALANQERVQRVALLGAPAGSAQGPPLRERLLAVPVLGGLIHSSAWPASRASARVSLRRDVAHPDRLSDALLDAVRAGARLPGAERTALGLRRSGVSLLGGSPLTYALRDELKELKLPVLLVWGKREPCPVRWGEELRDRLPDARLEVVPDAGHLVWLDEPDLTTTLLRDFLDSSAQLEVHRGQHG